MPCQLWIRKCSEELQSNLKTFSQMRGTHSLLKLEMMCGFTRVVVWLEPRKCPQCRIWNSWKWDIGGNQILCLAADLVPSNAHLQLPNSSEKCISALFALRIIWSAQLNMRYWRKPSLASFSQTRFGSIQFSNSTAQVLALNIDAT